MKYLIDSYAWIEYLDGTECGEKIKEFFSEENEIFSIPLVLAEVIGRTKRKEMDIDTAFKAIVSSSIILNIDAETSKEAGILHAEMKKTIRDFGLTDAFILAMARKLKAKIVTGDEHFRKIKEAILIR